MARVCMVACTDYPADTRIRREAEALVARGSPREQFSVLMNVPDERLFSGPLAPPEPGRFRLVYHGRVGVRHGLEVAVRAVALARDEVPGVELVVIGDGERFAEVVRLVAGLHLEEAVQLHRGFRRAEHVVPLLRTADAGVVSILDDEFTRYMLPTKLLEYVALGLPVIASETATIRAYFSPEMLELAPPGDPHALARRIVALHRDPDRRARLAAAGGRFTAEHGWQRERARYYELIDALAPGLTPAHVPVLAGTTPEQLEVSST